MNSPFARLLLQLQQRISDTVPEIAYIDQDLGQLNKTNTNTTRPAIAWPCVLIDITDFGYSNLCAGAQIATGHVVLRIAFNPYATAKQGAPAEVQQKALQFYDTEYALYKALEGWQPQGFSALTRTHAATEKNEAGIRIRTMRFAITFEDYGATKEITTISVPLHISLSA